MAKKCEGKQHSFCPCDRPATVEIEGKWFCWQHNPVRLKKIADEKWTARKAEIKAKEEEWDRRDKTRDLLKKAGVDRLTDEDLVTIADLGGIQSMILKLKGEQNGICEQ